MTLSAAQVEGSIALDYTAPIGEPLTALPPSSLPNRSAHPNIACALRRRSAIDHIKADGGLDKNVPLGHDGNVANAIFVAAAHNLRLILKAIASCGVYIIAAIRSKS
jgi:hypothetical protein